MRRRNSFHNLIILYCVILATFCEKRNEKRAESHTHTFETFVSSVTAAPPPLFCALKNFLFHPHSGGLSLTKRKLACAGGLRGWRRAKESPMQSSSFRSLFTKVHRQAST